MNRSTKLLLALGGAAILLLSLVLTVGDAGRLITGAATLAPWQPRKGPDTVSHFWFAWRDLPRLGQPTSPEWHNRSGWHQKFSRGQLDETDPTRHRGLLPTANPTTQPTVQPTTQPTAQPTNPPVVTITPRPTIRPIPTATPGPVTLEGYLLGLLNAERLHHGVAPLRENTVQDVCSRSHSRHMAQEGFISHDEFPWDVCIAYRTAGENVGMALGLDEKTALGALTEQMLSEPWSPGCSGNHHCNIDNPRFAQVGLGLFLDPTGTWLTEDFTD